MERDINASEFHDILLDKGKQLENKDNGVVESTQSSHIDKDLQTKSMETNNENVNNGSNLTMGAKTEIESESSRNPVVETQISPTVEDDGQLLDIPQAFSSEPMLVTEKEQVDGTQVLNRSTPDNIDKATASKNVTTSKPSIMAPNIFSFDTNENKTATEPIATSQNDTSSSLIVQPSPQSTTSAEMDEVSHIPKSSPLHQIPITLHTQPPSPTSALSHPLPISPKLTEDHNRIQEQLKNYEGQIEQLKKALSQKDNTIMLYQRENSLLEKEKLAFRKEKELATKEKESIVIKFATKEKSLIDAKKQKDSIDKQLADSRKEVKNISTKFHALNEEKSRITHMLDEKCTEVKKFQKDWEKLKADFNNLEMKLKWNMVKLAQETEAKLAAEKKLEEERNAPNPAEEKANEKLKVQYEATTILLKHELENKEKTVESLTKELQHSSEKITQLQDSISKEILEKTNIVRELECLRQEHATVQNSYSEEMLNSAKLRGQLEELQVLRTQHTINEDKIGTLNANLRDLEEKVQDTTQDLEQLQTKERELLSINKEMSEMIVGLQNEICLQTSKVKGVEAENELLKKEKLDFDAKYDQIESQLKQEIQQKNDERQLLTKHLSEKTKLYESVKVKLDNALGDLDATKRKHSQVVKELQREIQKYKKSFDEITAPSSPTSQSFCRNCQLKSTSEERLPTSHSRGSNNSRSDSESEAQSTTSTMNRDVQGPSKQHLVERILRLQQASARQTEKIDFLENHTLSLVAELQKKSKVVQYYMMRDQAGALTSSKSDQNKTELAKYGGVMSAIYSGIKGPNQSMTLELSLEINKKLQAVLEDTLLKNITLKENLDVLGLEVDKLTRKLSQIKS